VEEITTVQIEIDCWLTELTVIDIDAVCVPSSSLSPSLTASHPQSSALSLSSSLIKAMLAHLVAFSDASKSAKRTEASLRLKLDKLELEKGRLEADLHK
jgi:hypothetical protein